MHMRFLAALALAAPASPIFAQAAAPTAADYSYATPLPGTWAHVALADGSQAIFRDSSGRPQFTMHCTRSQRRVALSKPSGAAASALFVWTSNSARSVPAAFQPAQAQLSAALNAMDPLLDSMAFSRGRIAVSAAGAPALVMPVGAEISRVVEDCRV